ncbi:MAG: TetR/AcrR family transcriptional regulator [Spirochaetes bacterium]|jgi:AcrR family transcriptional regulator|nr:TetR/AcrR family transcriptional regulator [Spirochaetota bacterium]
MSNRNIRVPQQDRGKESKNSIIEAGLRLFSEKGYYKTNSKEIAKRAGVSIGSFYMYFADKKALFREIVELYNQKICDVLNDIEDPQNSSFVDEKTFLNYLITKLIEAHAIYPQLHQELTVMAASDPDIAKVYNNTRVEAVNLAKRFLSSRIEKLRIRDIDTVSVLIQTTMEEIVHIIVFSDVIISKEKLINETTDMLYRYLYKDKKL